ncbi:hypothetical protein GE21DRAFT_1210300 [Neurospora crassa]|nr:hypothetical protein GE21DRAFT_1210300 [Neurospora crassa]
MNWTPHPPLSRYVPLHKAAHRSFCRSLKVFAMSVLGSTSSDRYLPSTSGDGAYKSLLLWVWV